MSTKSRLQKLSQAEKRLTKVYGIISKIQRGDVSNFNTNTIAKIKKELESIDSDESLGALEYFDSKVELYEDALDTIKRVVDDLESDMKDYLDRIRYNLRKETESPTKNVNEDDSEKDDPYFTIIKEKGGVVEGYNYSIGGL